MLLKLRVNQLATSCACDGRVTALGGANMCVPLLSENRTHLLGFYQERRQQFKLPNNGNVLSIASGFFFFLQKIHIIYMYTYL